MGLARASDRDGHLGHTPDRRVDRLVHGLGPWRKRTQGPLAVAGEEAEMTTGRGRYLGGELAGPVEEPHVGVGHGLAVTHDLPLDHRLLRDVDALEGKATGLRAAHQASASPASSPSTTGTPTSEPY